MLYKQLNDKCIDYTSDLKTFKRVSAIPLAKDVLVQVSCFYECKVIDMNMKERKHVLFSPYIQLK